MTLHLVFLLFFLRHVECGNFLGASMSYNFIDNNTAEVTLITNWVLGHGLCGPGCSTADIGPMSIPTGTSLTAKYPDFGRFKPSNINNQITSNGMEVQIIAVSQKENWEQDLLKFTIYLNDSLMHELEYVGEYWKDFYYQGTSLPWNIRDTINPLSRDDIHKPNSSPQVLLRPYYSVKWNGTTFIHLSTADEDGDVVKCELAQYRDIGALTIPHGVKVNEDCSIQIDAFRSDGYINDTWFGLAVVLLDYNTDEITIGSDVLLPEFSITHSVVQFAIHIIDVHNGPVFIEPTPSVRQKYSQYIGSEWNIRLCAKGLENKDISGFNIRTIDNTTITQSALQDGKEKDREKCVELSWLPSIVDIGPHLICIAAVDTNEMVSDDDRCYAVEVKGEKFNEATNISMTKPYFVDVPGNDGRVQCLVNTVCVLPLYVRSATKVSTVKLIKHYTKMAKTSEVKSVLRNGGLLYQADVSFSDNSHGMKELCAVATDEHGTSSDETCFNAEIYPDDPCYSSPCRNSARCKMVDTSGAFICECGPLFSGRLCEKMENRCLPNPCIHGYCVDNFRHPLCYCKPGFTGTYCETSKNDCPGASCNSRGACVDKVNGYSCDCTQRYTGDNCETDICPAQSVEQFSCDVPAECNPNPCVYGKCSAGPSCSCATGYQGHLCDTAIDDSHNSTENLIIPPSPPHGSHIVCYKNNSSLLPCHLMVYVSTNRSINIKMDSSPGLETTWKVGLTKEVNTSRNDLTVLITLEGNLTTNLQPYVCLSIFQTGSEPSVCYSINIQPDPMASNTSLQYLQQNATWKFLDPTLKSGSRIMCAFGKPCRIMLYTNSYNETCHDIVPTSTANLATLFPPYYHKDVVVCSTEVDINLKNGTETEVCFLAGSTHYQQLCLMVDELSPLENPCVSNPCQHKGRCFYDSPQKYHCVCNADYVGDNCETGPCSQGTDDCRNGGYCLSYNTTNTCICRTGYAGSKCEIFLNSQPHSNKPSYFFGAAKPTMIECVVNQECSFSQIIEISNHIAHIPIVLNGFVSAGLTMNTNVVPRNHSFEADVMLLARRAGLHDACVQIRNQQGQIDDELCFKVRAITDPYTLYGRKNRPHFVGSSLSTGTQVECVAGEPCHILYQVTTGEGNENDCNEVEVTPSDDFAKYHVFSTCDTCSIRGIVNATCSVDVSVVTDVTDAGTNHIFSVLARLRESGLEGEERTFNLTISTNDTLTDKSGCQTIRCLNEGFCDGHVPGTPQCFCKQGYSGVECEKAEIQMAASNLTQTFIGDIAVPSEIECESGTVGSIPFQVVRKPGTGDYKAPKIELGYANDSISVDGPFIVEINTEEYIGYVNVSCIKTGIHSVCLQTGKHGVTEDDICVAVKVVARSEKNVDENYPYFLEPTLPDGSVVLCEVNKSCHLDIHYTTGDLFGIGGTCPQMVEANGVALNGMHIFEPKIYSHYCKTDVVYLPPETNVTRQLCLQVSLPGKTGEIRCVNIKVVDKVLNEVSAPCRTHECGDVSRFKCVTNFTTSPPFAECVCQTGFTDASCSATTTCNKVCANGGYCDQDVCFCVDGYGGEHCEIVFNPCASGPCDRGLCFHHQTDYHCVCPPGYDGKTCNIDINECTSQPCYNGGICVDSINNYTCNCSSGFTGERCQTNVNECLSNPCLHGGTCHDEVDQYSCQCTPEYKGERCETEVNPCDSSPCIHGQCFHHLLSLHCVCEVGYTGKHCETDINECASAPCMNGGTCIDEINQFSCSCSAGFTGVLCETDINECASNPCLNGGFCHDELDHFTCHCPSGFEGVKCEKIVDPCLPNPCNTGVCFSMGQQIFCDCPQRYTGKFCEIYLGLQLIGPKEVTLNVNTGSEINLNCSVSSNNPVTFVWNKMNLCEDLSNGTYGSVLEVTKNATIGNIGTFVCTATDSIDPTITKYFNVYINVHGFTETCNFDESSLCRWNKHDNGGMDWVLRNGINSSIDGGILFDHTTGSALGNYLYIETTLNRNFDDRAVLVSSILPAKHTLCFEFWYYLYGNDVGQMAVILQDTCLKTETRVFIELGNQGNKWHKSSSTINSHSVPNDYRIIIKADIGSTVEGDVAIDDLSISDGDCKGDLNPAIIG